METSTASASEEIQKNCTPENVDVEMAVVGTMVNKPDKNDLNSEMSPPKLSPKKKDKKKRKRKSISPDSSHKKTKKDPNKPEYPKVGYVRFMFARREELRNEFPDMHHLDVTKKIGEEWTTMCEEKKAPYLEAAKEDKIRYKKEMKEYTKNLTSPTTNGVATKGKKKKAKKNASTTDSSFEESRKKTKKPSPAITNGLSKETNTSKLSNGILQNGSKPKLSHLTAGTERKMAASILTPSSPLPLIDSNIMPIYGDIPIFTDQFLEHNRQMESELKKLRKLNTDYEQQNAVLEKHVENVRNGITKTNAEITDIQSETEKLSKYLDMLKQKLAHQLRNLSIPDEPNGATIENIAKYMNDLYEMAKNDSHGPASLNKAKDLLRKVDLNIDLKTFHGI